MHTRPMRLGVYIGRFQPFHLGHLHVVRQALAHCDRLLILIGSADEPRTTQNPWTAAERGSMIRAGLPGDIPDVTDTAPVRDFESNFTWAAGVRAAVQKHLADLGWSGAEVLLAGHAKDHTSFYLGMFPEWGSLDVDNFRQLSATPMRERFFDCGQALAIDEVGIDVHDWAEEWFYQNAQAVGWLTREYGAVREFRAHWRMAPHPPTFITTDALVVSAGHVAVIQRGKFPFRGLRALPGGFLEPNLSLLDNTLKEFSEECLDGKSAELLRSHLREVRVFDAPGRDPRGRFVSHVHLFDLHGAFPTLTGGDDAEWAGWVPIDRLERSEMAFDHFKIIRSMTARHVVDTTLKAA